MVVRVLRHRKEQIVSRVETDGGRGGRDGLGDYWGKHQQTKPVCPSGGPVAFISLSAEPPHPRSPTHQSERLC